MMARIEDQHQEALINWASYHRMPDLPNVEPGAVVLDYLIAIPNGGGRSKGEAGRLKAQGVKAGVWDLLLPVPVNGCPGMWIELKRPATPGRPKGYLSKEQKAWGVRMDRAGYVCVPCWHWTHAREAILTYISQGSILTRFPMDPKT